jgi:holo-[acyl-carrier protein] synthase
MILGVGHDLCEIDRIERMVVRWGARFTERVFTEHERQYCLSKVNRAQHLAARFAVKEATLKALNVPAGLSWKEMKVVGGGKTPPRLELEGKAKEAADAMGVEQFHITITHAGGFASAVVIAERG